MFGSLLLCLPFVHPFQSADLPLQAARTALEAGRRDEARMHLFRAAEREPERTDIYELGLEGLGSDPDELWFWSTLAAQRLAAERGRIPGSLRSAMADAASLEEWCARRVFAVQELEEFAAAAEKKARRRPEERMVARWGRRVALDLGRGNFWLENKLADLSPRLDPTHPWHKAVLPDLERALDKSRGDHGLAIELARVLTGLAAQARFQDLQGPRPRLGDLGQRAQRVLDQQRKSLRDGETNPWNQDDLEWLTRPEGESFTREHGDFARPGVALSPTGLYRIESECGAETMEGVVATIELHHQRLVNWYGQDPFEGIPGLVRVVKSHAGLEAEGAPFYWVGGFQGGNTTTVRFALGTIEGLGHTLTHELTHRFDGAIFPGQPAWLTEGKAVWTAAAYQHSSDENFLEDHALLGTLESAFYDGYGNLNKLKNLLAGEPDDYRDNYVAGYALYVFLRSWRKDGESTGDSIFRDQLDAYMPALAGFKRDPVGVFEGFFADGAGGRPSGIEEFSELFQTYLAGFYWKDRKPWAKWYAGHKATARGGPIVMDEPTWTWERQRSEPFFGQDQARLGAELLVRAGADGDALGAYAWALAADGRSPFVERAFAAVAQREKRKELAFVLDSELAFPAPFPYLRPESKAPFLKRLESTRAYLESTEALASAARQAKAERTAAALEADAERLRSWLGMEARVPQRSDSSAATIDAPGRSLKGWQEARLAGYDKRRVPDLWYVDDREDLHVGRRAPSEATGVEARARQRHAYARADRYVLPGTWRLRTRIQFTTSYANGCVVIGSDRRDRDIRFQFNAGDFNYAIGESEEEPTFDQMNWSLVGRFQREGILPDTKPSSRARFGAPRTAFDLELLVDGPLVLAFINGKQVGTYATPDGAPLEGYIGFAMNMGAVRVERPILERLDRARLCGLLDAQVGGLDLARGAAPEFDDLLARPLAGLPTSVNGLLVLWVPSPEEGDDLESEADTHLRATEKLAELAHRADVTQPIALSLPEGLDPTPLIEVFNRPPLILQRKADEALPVTDKNRRWLLLVDPMGRIRHTQKFATLSPTFREDLYRWIDALRDYGRPERELPPLIRASEQEQEER